LIRRTRISRLMFHWGAVAVLISPACSSDKGASDKEEGVIEFQTKALDETHPLYGFAPDNAVLRFKGNRFVLEMSTMGMFNMSIIADNKARTMAQTVKFMNIKQASIEHEKEIEESNLDYPLKIEETGETKKMLGFKCYKLKVTKANEPGVTFDAWYTKDLGLENCNALTPYSPIKGVLMDYRIKKFGMEMHFLAKSYKHAQVPDQVFEIPASMKVVGKPEMEKFFQDLQ
jgi:hypothetical protein